MRDEFNCIVEDILLNDEFNKLKLYSHHGITRHEHCLRVAYYSYLVTKFFHLKYIDTTRAALLHDFFTDEVSEFWALKRYRNHPKYALENSKKYFEINSFQENIILRHMFPVTFIPPKYIESWIVDIVDDVSAVYDKLYSIKRVFCTFMKSIIGVFKV